MSFFEVSLIILAAGTLQSAVGFGFSLLAVPMMLFLDMPLPEAVAISIVCSAVQRLVAVSHLRKAVDWRSLIPMMIAGLLALPLGILLMYHIAAKGQATVKQIVGLCVLFLLILQWSGIIKPQEKLHWIWAYVAALCSGILNGLANIGGPPIVLWILAHRWPCDKMRVTSMAFSLIFIPFQVILLPLVFGSTLLSALLTGLYLSPAVLLGTWTGLKIGGRMKAQPMRVLINIILLCIAMVSILSPLLKNN